MAAVGTPRARGLRDLTFLPRSSSSNVGSPRSLLANRSTSGAGGHLSSMGRSESNRSALVPQLENGVEDAEQASQAALEEIEGDEIFSRFLAPNFNATTFASQVLANGTAVASARKLGEGIVLLEKQLRSEVVHRHGELLQQLTSLQETESVLAVVRSGVNSLQASVQRVRSEIAEPYKLIKLKTGQLAALHDTMELLRVVIKVLKQVKKLQDHMAPVAGGGAGGGGKVDLAKAAQLFAEVEGLRREADLVGVEAVDAQVPWLAETGQFIRAEALKALETSMENLNQVEVGDDLQVFYNMGELRATVDGQLAKYKAAATKAVSTALDMKAISASGGGLGGAGPGGIARSGTPQLGATAKARDALWQRMQQCRDSAHATLLATWHLQRVLAKKRDPISHVVFLDEVVQPGDAMPVERVWEAVVRALTAQLKGAFTASSFAKETFVGAFPRLLALFQGLLDRLAHETGVKGVPPAVAPEHRAALLAALEPFQAAFLGQSLTRLTDVVGALFPAGSRGAVPGGDAALRIVSRIGEEVEAVRADTHLTLLVLQGVNTALQLLAERAEYQVGMGTDARQVAGPATGVQQRNVALCLLLQEVHQRLSAVLPQLPPGAPEKLAPGLAAVHGVASEAVTPLFKAMVERVEQCLLGMHDEDFGGESGDDSAPSRYLEETAGALAHFRVEFLSRLLPSLPQPSASAAAAAAAAAGSRGGDLIATALTREMAARVLAFFVRHAALLRPLSEAGKLRLARDMAELEFAVGQSLFPVEHLGAPYRQLRAFRSLLFLDTAALPSSPLLQDIQPSAVLHHLYSRAPPELQSPPASNGLTPQRYSMWLDLHSEEEAWRGVRATLDAYARTVQARGAKEFSPLYPLMLSLGQQLLEGGGGGARGG